MSKTPLVSYVLVAYNQENFIREAVESAFGQTYSPLQVILSDDCSSDSTFEIMQQLATSYAGQHELLLNKNIQNLGLARHLNLVMSLAKGEFIVVAAGDDISIAERTSLLIDRFLCKDRPLFIFSDLVEIGVDGSLFRDNPVKQIEQSLAEFIHQPGILGAACAWDRRIFSQFPPLLSEVVAEDMVLPVRAYLLGKPPILLDKQLVKYRRDAQRNKGPAKLTVRIFWQIWPFFTAARQHLLDLNHLQLFGSDYAAEIVNNTAQLNTKIAFLKYRFDIAFLTLIWRCLRLFGMRGLYKLLIIKLSGLPDREQKLLHAVTETTLNTPL